MYQGAPAVYQQAILNGEIRRRVNDLREDDGGLLDEIETLMEEGFTEEEIAKELRLTLREVRAYIQMIADRWLALETDREEWE